MVASSPDERPACHSLVGWAEPAVEQWQAVTVRDFLRSGRASAAEPDAVQPVKTTPAMASAEVPTGARDERPKRPLDDVSFGVQVAAWWSLCLILIVSGVITLFWLLNEISLVTITIAVAIMITALLQPMVALLTRWKVPRTLAVLIVFLGGIAIISWLLWFVISQIAYSKDSLLDQLNGGLASVRDWLVHGPLEMTPKQADRFSVQLGDTLQQQFGGSSEALDRATGAIGVLSGGVFCLFATLFMLFDRGRMWAWFVSMFPDHIHDHAQEAGQAAWRTLTAYMRSLVLLAAINALAMVPVMMIADMPLVVPLAVLLFLGSLVPLIGVLVAGVVVCLIAFVSQGLTTAIVVAVALVLIVQLFGNLLNPIILGKAVDIHPLAILVGVTGGTLLAGIFGAFVAVPLIAVLNNAIKAVRHHHTSRPNGSTADSAEVAKT